MVSEVLKEYKRNKAKLKNKQIQLEQLREDLEVHQDLLSREDYEFTREEIIDELSLSATSYDNYSAPTNKFNSRTENAALDIDEAIERAKPSKEKLTEGLYKIRGNINTLESEIKRIQRNVERIENALEGLNVKQKFIVERKHIDEYQWDEVEEMYNVTFQKNPLGIDRLKEIREDAFKILEEVI